MAVADARCDCTIWRVSKVKRVNRDLKSSIPTDPPGVDFNLDLFMLGGF